MKEENEHSKTIKMIEYSLVIIVLFVVLIITIPSVNTIIYNISKESAITSTYNTVKSVKAIYTSMNLKNEVSLPFKAVFDKENYTFYENNKKVNYKYSLNIKFEGKLPSSGTIIINIDGTTTVKDLTFGNISCNQISNSTLICDKKW